MLKKTAIVCSLMLLFTVAVQAATVSGVVKENDSTGAAISGATVTLTPTGGGGTALVDTTDATGAFSFANVPGSAAAPVTYRINAAKTGYRVMTTFTRIQVNNVAGAFTQNLYLTSTAVVAVRTISGTISDSVAGSALTALAGARVILSQRTVTGTTGIDTVTTGTNGGYTIDSVAVGAYTLTVSKIGYATQTGNVAVALVNIVQNFKLLHVLTASVTGTVSDSATTTGIVGAKVYLLTRGGGGLGTIIDSAVATTGGTYTIANVPSSTAGINYTVRASATDYVTASANVTVTGTTAQTVNIKLVAIQMASITGTVTDSTTVVAPVAGVRITLRTGGGGGGGGTIIDSAFTGTDGKYTIADVPSGVTYTLRAEATTYVTSNTNVNLTGTAARTLNIRLVKIPSGNLYVLVKARADSAIIPGASVSATIGTTVLNGTTGTSGLVSFLAVATGNYAITVSAANFTPISSTTTLIVNRNDTVRVYLVAATGGTKMLKGTVVDSSSAAKTPLAHVAVVLTVQGAGIGGATLTLVDSTDATGAYAIVGIPASRTTGALTATLTSYRVFTNARVTLGAAATADTTTLRIALIPVQSSIHRHFALSSLGSPEFNVSSSGFLRLNNFNDAGVVQVFSLNGKTLFKSRIAEHTTSLALPNGLLKSGSLCIVSISQKDAIYRKQILIQ
jgi:large repetitive protein